MRGLGIIDPPFLASLSPLTPGSFANLARWYKADSFPVLSDGTAVANSTHPWNDSSGNGVNINVAAGAAPTYQSNSFNGQPAIQYLSASSQFSQLPTAWSVVASGAGPVGTFTAILITSFDASNQIPLGYSGANLQLRFRGGTPGNCSFNAGTGVTSLAFTHNQGSLRMTSFRRIDASGTIKFRDGNIDVPNDGGGATDTNAFTLDYIGRYQGGLFVNGKIGEICLYSTALSDTNLDKLYTQYFKPKWGLP